MVELRQLRHVIALAEHRKYARASGALHITQPALTRSIQGIEAQLGAPLFDRGPREVTPTAIGELVLRHARAIAHAAHDLERDVGLAKGMDLGELRVGAGPFVGATLVGEVVARMSRTHPKLRSCLRQLLGAQVGAAALGRDRDAQPLHVRRRAARRAARRDAADPATASPGNGGARCRSPHASSATCS